MCGIYEEKLKTHGEITQTQMSHSNMRSKDASSSQITTRLNGNPIKIPVIFRLVFGNLIIITLKLTWKNNGQNQLRTYWKGMWGHNFSTLNNINFE